MVWVICSSMCILIVTVAIAAVVVVSEVQRPHHRSSSALFSVLGLFHARVRFLPSAIVPPVQSNRCWYRDVAGQSPADCFPYFFHLPHPRPSFTYISRNLPMVQGKIFKLNVPIATYICDNTTNMVYRYFRVPRETKQVIWVGGSKVISKWAVVLNS